MQRHYFFNNNVNFNGDREVHAEDCSFILSFDSHTYIGAFESQLDAFRTVRKRYPDLSFDLCIACCAPPLT